MHDPFDPQQPSGLDLSGLSDENRKNILALFADLREGPLNKAYRDLAEVVGQDKATSLLLQSLFGQGSDHAEVSH